MLVLARVLQGLTGGGLLAKAQSILFETFPKSEQGKAQALFGVVAIAGPAIGPVLGGYIVTNLDWRWIFYINLPIAAAGVLLVARHVPNVAEQQTSPIDWTGIFLTGFGMAALIFGLETLGRSDFPPWLVGGLFIAGMICLALYWRHARGNPHAILDLSLFRIQTFTASVIGGGFMRLAMGATPFMLALLLQIGFGMSPFQAGLLTFISAAGALVMKTAAPPILRRFGFRSVLVVNAVITGLLFMAYALFKPGTPHWLIMAVLLFGGFFRSLQFTSLNGLAYADIDQQQMSRASTMSAMAQQLVQSLGIGLAAMLLHVFMVMEGASGLTASSISPAFLVVGALSFVSLAFFIRLPATAGDDMHRR
jgi:MFS family permease